MSVTLPSKSATNAIFKELDRMVGSTIKGMAKDIHGTVLARTPVWSGEAERNWKIGVGAPPSSDVIAEAPNPHEIKSTQFNEFGAPDPAEVGDDTREVRRRANEMAAAREQQKLSSLDKKPYQKVYISNPTEQIEGLEFGRLPDKPSMTPRTPAGGIARVAIIEAVEKVGGSV